MSEFLRGHLGLYQNRSCIQVQQHFYCRGSSMCIARRIRSQQMFAVQRLSVWAVLKAIASSFGNQALLTVYKETQHNTTNVKCIQRYVPRRDSRPHFSNVDSAFRPAIAPCIAPIVACFQTAPWSSTRNWYPRVVQVHASVSPTIPRRKRHHYGTR